MKPPRNLVKAVYREAKKARRKDRSLSLCQHMEICAKKFGYNGLDHLQKDYAVRAIKSSLERRRLACAELLPDDRLNSYYQFDINNEDASMGYYSHWAGYDEEGYELRVPSLIRGEILIKIFRETMGRIAYVIEDLESLYQWRFVWGGLAVINAELVETNPLFQEALEPSRSNNPFHRRIPPELDDDIDG